MGGGSHSEHRGSFLQRKDVVNQCLEVVLLLLLFWGGWVGGIKRNSRRRRNANYYVHFADLMRLRLF